MREGHLLRSLVARSLLALWQAQWEEGERSLSSASMEAPTPPLGTQSLVSLNLFFVSINSINISGSYPLPQGGHRFLLL